MVDFPSSPTDGQTHTENGSSWTYNDPPGCWQVTSSSDPSASDPSTIGMMACFPVNNIPDNWLPCDGSTFSSATYPGLATFLGGTTLPNMTDRFVKGIGAQSPLTTGGESAVTLTTDQMPVHAHGVYFQDTAPSGGSQNVVSGSGGADGSQQSASSGGGQPHNNEPEYTVLVWAIRAASGNTQVDPGNVGIYFAEFHDPTGSSSWSITGTKLECWGRAAGGDNIAFSKTFADTNIEFTATAINSGEMRIVTSGPVSTTGVTAYTWNSLNIATNSAISWRAVGKWDGN